MIVADEHTAEHAAQQGAAHQSAEGSGREGASTPERPSKVAVLAENPIVGRALDLLLTGAGYDVRLVGHPTEGDLSVPLEGANLLLIAPMMDAETSRKILDDVGAMADLTALPVLALVTAPSGHPLEGGRARQVPWPCRTAELRREIETALTRPHLG